jgi:hypothetical protein
MTIEIPADPADLYDKWDPEGSPAGIPQDPDPVYDKLVRTS